MKKIVLFATTVSLLTLFSCDNNSTSNTNETEVKTSSCFYVFHQDSMVNVSWTAFKTTEKVGVGGKFDQVMVVAGDKSTKIPEVLQQIKFSIPTNSTNTNNPDRDQKIINFYFGNMKNTDLIIGQVKNVAGDNNEGVCTFFLTLNEVEKELPLNYKVDDHKITLKGELDILNWQADDALNALNEACYDLHKGADGKSVTWPNVELLIEAHLQKSCH